MSFIARLLPVANIQGFPSILRRFFGQPGNWVMASFTLARWNWCTQMRNPKSEFSLDLFICELLFDLLAIFFAVLVDLLFFTWKKKRELQRIEELIIAFHRATAQRQDLYEEMRLAAAAARREAREEMRREWRIMGVSSKIRRFVYNGCRRLSEADLLIRNICLICYGDFQVGENVPRIPHPCLENNNFMHGACLERWFKQTAAEEFGRLRCPICKQNVG